MSVAHARSNASYLPLVRDSPTNAWKASGYFSGIAAAVTLPTDDSGMLQANVSPLLLSKVRCAPKLTNPEFIAGSGEDADGDGLLDIYEVLVTKTNPDLADTGSTGVLDGYKNPTGDGWTNLEKFRRRIDPFSKAALGPIELTEPTRRELLNALGKMERSDLRYQVTVEVRNFRIGEKFHPAATALLAPNRQTQGNDILANLQFRITAHVPEQKHRN